MQSEKRRKAKGQREKRSRHVTSWVALVFALAPLIASYSGGGEDRFSGFILFLPALGFTVVGALLLVVDVLRAKYKGWIYHLAAQVLVFALTYSNYPYIPGERYAQSIRVMTFNVQFGVHHTPEKIVAAIRKQNPDIVVFQESWMSGFREPFQGNLRRLLKDYDSFAKGQMMICSKRSIRTRRTNSFPGNPDLRPLLEVVVNGPGEIPITILNTHMAATHLSSHVSLEYESIVDVRRDQVNAILRRVDDIEGPVILAGDFNITPWHYQYHRIRSRLTDSQSGFLSNLQYTVPANFPVKKLDYILHRGFAGSRSWVPNENVSDHEPLVADLYFQG